MLIAEHTNLHLRLLDLTLKTEYSLEGSQQIKERTPRSGRDCGLWRRRHYFDLPLHRSECARTDG
jgi:hypothetical protein